MPSPGGQISGMAGHQRAGLGWVDRVGHPVDLPPGLPHGDPGAELPESLTGRVEGCPRVAARSGLHQIDGMPHEPQRARSSVTVRQQKGITKIGRAHV